MLADCRLSRAHTDVFFLPLQQREALAEASAAAGMDHKNMHFIHLYSQRCVKALAEAKSIVRGVAWREG